MSTADEPTRIVGPWAEWLNDQREHWLRGDCLRVEDFLARAPDLADSPEGVGDLIGSEIRLRENRGESPTLDEYLWRFPRYAPYLRQRFMPGDHTVISAGGAPGPADFQVSPQGRDAPPRPQVPGYEILAEVARGNMGVVYKARQVAQDRIVALKMLLLASFTGEEEIARFRNEAECITRLLHPNIVQVYDVGDVGGHPYFAMEFIEGGSLAAQRGDNLRPFPWAARLIAIVARAVHHIHQHGIIHRDLKPANILLQQGSKDCTLDNLDLSMCVPKVSDFGLAKRIDLPGDQTRTGTLLGTPNFMAPEQAACQVRQIGCPADIYSLGAILYDLLTGRPPFQGDSVLAVLEQVRTEEPIAPSRLNSKVPRELETICLKCLEKEPNARYASADDLADDLEHFLRDEPIRAQPPSAWKLGWKWVRRQPLFAGLVGLVLFSVVGLTFLTFFAYWSSHRLVDDRERMENALEILVEHQRLSSSLMDAETSQRGYLLTGDRAYLGPYKEALLQIPPALDRLVELARNPRQMERLNALRRTIDGRLQMLEETIAKREQQDGLAAAARAVQLGHGKRAMDEVRSLLATIEADERKSLVQRNAEVDATTRTATLVLVAAVLCASTLLLTASVPLLGMFTTRKRKRRNVIRAEQQVK